MGTEQDRLNVNFEAFELRNSISPGLVCLSLSLCHFSSSYSLPPPFLSLSVSLSIVPLFIGPSLTRRSLVPPLGSRSLSQRASFYISPSLKATLFPSREIAASLSSPRGPILSFLSALSPFHLVVRAFEFSLSRSRPDTPRTCPSWQSVRSCAPRTAFTTSPLVSCARSCAIFIFLDLVMHIDPLFISFFVFVHESDILKDERKR